MESTHQTKTLQGQALKEAAARLSAEEPRLYPRDIAARLGVSEGELAASKTGENTVRLEGTWQNFVKRLPQLNKVMSLTRNEGCVLEHKGTFQKVQTFGEGHHAMGQILGPIETRIFFHAWHVAFYISQPEKKGFKETIQVFDKSGEAVTKIYLDEKNGNRKAWDQLIADFKSKDQSNTFITESYQKADTLSKEEIDAKAFRNDWKSMKDTHEFFSLLRRHQVHRIDALHLAGKEFAYRVKPEDLQLLLENAAETAFPIMIFAGNRGNVQIHQGKINRVVPMNHWLNIMDPNFNMHLRMDLVNDAWVVRKQTKDGIVTSLELFSKERELIAQFFGLRKFGKPEKEDWRKLIYSLEKV